MVEMWKKKPLTVRAVLWDGRNLKEIYEFLEIDIPYKIFKKRVQREGVIIANDRGRVKVYVDDYIMKNSIEGLRVCRSDIFKRAYEKVEKKKEPFLKRIFKRKIA